MDEEEIEPKLNSNVMAKKKDVRAFKMNIWMISSIALIIILAAVLVFGSKLFGTTTSTSNALKPEEASLKAVKFINDNLVQPNTTASYVSSKEFEGVYNITVSYQGRDVSVYLSKDGSYMFLSAPLDITQPIPQPTQQQQPTETPKTAKPTVQLYVMAFCPYGIQAEDAMKPVVDLLGSKADIQVHFIATVSGTTPDTVQSLHGPVEAQEDLRQVCIMKYYDQKTYWKYVMAIDATCSGQRSDATAYDACWKSAAKNASIDATEIDTCSKGSDGMTLIKADADLSSSKGVSGSPTLIINGVTYSGARTPDAYKEGICTAFTTIPTECSQNLSTTGSAASGGCAT
jgi:glutaredoxin